MPAGPLPCPQVSCRLRLDTHPARFTVTTVSVSTFDRVSRARGSDTVSLPPTDFSYNRTAVSLRAVAIRPGCPRSPAPIRRKSKPVSPITPPGCSGDPSPANRERKVASVRTSPIPPRWLLIGAARGTPVLDRRGGPLPTRRPARALAKGGTATVENPSQSRCRR
jgi:hypothetical protein